MLRGTNNQTAAPSCIRNSEARLVATVRTGGALNRRACHSCDICLVRPADRHAKDKAPRHPRRGMRLTVDDWLKQEYKVSQQARSSDASPCADEPAAPKGIVTA